MAAGKSTLFLGDLSTFCTEQDIHHLFAPFGEVVEIKIMRSEETMRNLSYGFIKFSNPVSAKKALNALDGSLFCGRNLRVGWASYKSKKDPKLPQHHDRLDSSSVHISYISYQLKSLITEESLRVLFSSFGVVLDCSIKKSYIDQSINRQCGYGFIHFSSSPQGIESALAAVAGLNDATLDEVCYKCSISHNLEKHLVVGQNRRFDSPSYETYRGHNSPITPVIQEPFSKRHPIYRGVSGSNSVYSHESASPSTSWNTPTGYYLNQRNQHHEQSSGHFFAAEAAYEKSFPQEEMYISIDREVARNGRQQHGGYSSSSTSQRVSPSTIPPLALPGSLPKSKFEGLGFFDQQMSLTDKERLSAFDSDSLSSNNSCTNLNPAPLFFGNHLSQPEANPVSVASSLFSDASAPPLSIDIHDNSLSSNPALGFGAPTRGFYDSLLKLSTDLELHNAHQQQAAASSLPTPLSNKPSYNLFDQAPSFGLFESAQPMNGANSSASTISSSLFAFPTLETNFNAEFSCVSDTFPAMH